MLRLPPFIFTRGQLQVPLNQAGKAPMFTRSEKLLIPLEKPANPDPNGAAAIQELLGGKFGEMSTLNNYLHQSFGFKEKKTTPNPTKNKK